MKEPKYTPLPPPDPNNPQIKEYVEAYKRGKAMKDIDKELDTQIKDILNFLDEKSHQSLGYNATVQAIKQLINQARIDENQLHIDAIQSDDSQLNEIFLIPFKERLDQLTAQSQPTKDEL